MPLSELTRLGHHSFKECSFENNEYLERCLVGGLSCEVEFVVMGRSPLVQKLKQLLIVTTIALLSAFSITNNLILDTNRFYNIV